MKKMNKKSGFTLVEIMIVVAIIGLLAAIGIPSFQKARNNSIEKSKLNNVRIVNAAVDQYAVAAGAADGDTAAVADYEVYIKGGGAALSIGDNTCTLIDATVGTDLTAADIY